MFVAAHHQPFLKDDTLECVPESDREQDRYQIETLEDMEFNRGDYFFCKRYR